MAGVTPVTSLKRKREDATSTNYKYCLFCQESNTDQLMSASGEGKKRVKDVALERARLKDTSYTIVLERLESITEEDWNNAENVKWHKICYSKFTAENKLQRLRNKVDRENKRLNITPDKDNEQFTGSRISRSTCYSVKWNLCIFCQSDNVVNLRQIATFALSEKIIHYSEHDLVMRVRLAGISDLIAAEGKYHLKCLVNFERKHKLRMATPQREQQDTDIIMDELCQNLVKGLSRGNVYDLGAVWVKYKSMCMELDVDPPDSYISRRKTFYDSVKEKVSPKGNFVRPLDMKAPLLLYPSDQSEYAIAEALSRRADEKDDDDEFDRSLLQNTTIEQEIVHTALQIRNDLEQTPGYSGGWHDINQESVNKIIPASLYTFLSVLFGGTTAIDNPDSDSDKVICSIAQDIVFAASKNRKMTPKHMGLGLTLHQATRSEQLVSLFHAAGHTIGIDTVRRIDTTIANEVLDKYEANGYVYIPANIAPYEPGRLIISSCDNIDVLEETIDGKNTFHCTQMVIWQRGPEETCLTGSGDIGRDKSLKKDRLQMLHRLDHARLPSGTRPSPPSENFSSVDPEAWLAASEERKNAKSLNNAWLLSRFYDYGFKSIPSWSGFNAIISKVDPPVTSIGMLPILQAPADANDTITTVINRFISINHKLGQKYTIIIGDQPLYSRAKELIWANPDMYKDVIVVLGDLHVLFNFLKVIGQHFECSGLDDVWVESGLFAQNSTEAMMNGKSYYRSVRGHMWTYEALYHIWWKRFLEWLDGENETLKCQLQEQISKVLGGFAGDDCDTYSEVTDLTKLLHSPALKDEIGKFHSQNIGEPNYRFWMNYMNMVGILLDFIRANRDGNWQLHLDAFSAMLPWMTIYDHTNYARWGPVYLADMKNLPSTAPEVHREFTAGNFVVKRSNQRFNQVPVDQATEWMNRMCKISNGIIGITRNDTARDRFCTTWAERSKISLDTKYMLGLIDDDVEEQAISTRKDDIQSARTKDYSAVNKLIETFHRFNVFKAPETDSDKSGYLTEETESGSRLMSLASNDVATNEVEVALLSAEERGTEKMLTNVRERLVEKTVTFFAPVKRNSSKTFASLYKCTTVNRNNEKKMIKADRRLIQQLLNAAQAGRTIDMEEVLRHELSPIPLALATIDGKMNSLQKSDLLNLLTESQEIDTPKDLPNPEEGMKTCIIIDGHALIQALGKPSNCATFNEYAEVFISMVSRKFTNSVRRIDVVFDRYIGQESIKTMTRGKRAGKFKRPIRKMINDGNVPMPQVWSQFIALDENKAELARFLSQRLIDHETNIDPMNEIVTAGGFEEPLVAKTSRHSDVVQLEANHEEADTRLILHAIHAINNGFTRVLVECRDTDVILMMIHFLGHLAADVWMISGTSKNRKCYPINSITHKLPKNVVENILGFHALTGCDSTSSFTGHGKKSCWKVFLKYPELLSGVGRNGSIEKVEEFVCRLYNSPHPFKGVNKVRHVMFQKGKKAMEMFPPTKDALELHIFRANYQARIWLQATTRNMDVGSPLETGGWTQAENELKVKWSRIPSIPMACVELVACGCKTKCKLASCKCYKSEQVCTPACGCEEENCCNPTGL